MNEWSPQVYYSSLTVADLPPQIQVPSQYLPEDWSPERNNCNTMNNSKIRECQNVADEFLSEDIVLSSVNYSKKRKHGTSDPRFKRVINAEFRSAGDSEAEKSAQNEKGPLASNQTNRDHALNDKVLSFLKTPNDCSMFMTPNIKCLLDQKELELSAEVTKDTGFQLPDKFLTNEKKKEFSYKYQNDLKDDTLDVEEKPKNSFKTNLKRSASDCTLQTKTLQHARENEVSENVRSYPSAVKLSNVENWMKYQKGLPEKRRSVITVIGQTQTKPFRQILNEIHQRRKLAKELDKHALCEALMSSMESNSDLKNVVAKVDLVLPDGKVIYSAEKVYMRKDNKLDGIVLSQNSLDSDNSKKKRCDMIPERDSSVCQLGKKKSKRTNKKLASPISEKFDIKGSIRNILKNVSPTVIWLLLVFLCFGLCFSVFFYTAKTPQNYYLFEFFKPKTAAWYEKLLF